MTQAQVAGSIQTTTFHDETGQEVIKILSDSKELPIPEEKQVSTSSKLGRERKKRVQKGTKRSCSLMFLLML